MNLSGFSFRNSRGILLSALFLSLLGGLVARSMPSAILPDFPFPRLVVIVEAGDMAIQDMIVRITRPLESAAAGVPGAGLVRSKTARGTLELSVDFEWNTDMFEAFTRLNANVATIRSTLPPETSIQVEWVNPSSFPVIGYSVTSDRVGPRDLADLANLTLAPHLSRLKGVYRILVQGGETREYQVVLDPSALTAAGITATEVSNALAEANLIQSVGRFNQRSQGYLVLVDAQIRKPEELLDLPIVTSRPGRTLKIRDVATIREADEERQQRVTANGREAVLLNILKQPGASTADVSDEVKAALKELRPHLPAGVTVAPFYDEADLLRESIGSLRDSILVGAALAILVVLAFLRSWRPTLVVLLCLPITVLIAFLGLRMVNQSINLMTLGGLAVGLGLIIDDVVVTLENIFRHHEMGKPPRQAALEGAAEIQKPMIGSTITTVAVFLPLAFLGEITGALFSPLSVTLTLLLVISVALAVTIVPLITSRLLPRDAATTQRAEPDERAPGLFERVMGLAIDYRGPILVAVGGVALLAAALVPTLPTGLMPEMDEGAFVLDYAAPGGTPLADTDRQVRVIEHEILATPEVEAYARRTGLEMGFFTTEPNTGDIMIKLKPRSSRSRSMSEIMEDLQARCHEKLPGMELEAVSPVADRVADIAGEPSPIEVKVFGDDPAVLQELAEKINKIVESVKGTGESVHDFTETGPEFEIHIDPRRAAVLGVTHREIARALEAAMLGRAESSAVSGERIIPIRVLFPRSYRRSVEQIGSLPVLSKTGERVPLSAIATLVEKPGAFEATRENQKPVTLVKATLHGRDLGSANREVQSRIAKEVSLPPGYTLQYGGLYEAQQKSFASLTTVLLVGMFLVFVVTVFQYNRFAEPIALVVAAALGMIGVVAALKITGSSLNASSMTGGIMIFGMVLTNGIVLMDTIRRRKSEGLAMREAIIAAGRERIRPVLMTASIAVLALLPLALGIGSGAEMQQPLAIAVIGGLLVSPIFTLIVAPAVLVMLSRK